MHLMDDPIVRREVLSFDLESSPYVFVEVEGTAYGFSNAANAAELDAEDADHIAEGYPPPHATARANAERGRGRVLELDASAGRGVAFFRAAYGLARNRLR